MVAALEYLVSHRANTRVVDRQAAQSDTLKFPTLSAMYLGRIRPIPLYYVQNKLACLTKADLNTKYADMTYLAPLNMETRYPATCGDIPTLLP
jgi:hypothetical protein